MVAIFLILLPASLNHQDNSDKLNLYVSNINNTLIVDLMIVINNTYHVDIYEKLIVDLMIVINNTYHVDIYENSRVNTEFVTRWLTNNPRLSFGTNLPQKLASGFVQRSCIHSRSGTKISVCECAGIYPFCRLMQLRRRLRTI